MKISPVKTALVFALAVYFNTTKIYSQSLFEDYNNYFGFMNQGRFELVDSLISVKMKTVDLNDANKKQMIIKLLNLWGSANLEIGNFFKSDSIFTSAKQYYQSDITIDKNIYADLLTNMIKLYSKMGRGSEQKHTLDELMIISNSVSERQIIFNNIISYYLNQGDYTNAGYLIKMIDDSSLGNKIDKGNYLNNLAAIAVKEKDFNSAEKYLEDALILSVREDGGIHPNYIKYSNNLGYLYEEMGQYEQAESLYTSSISLLDKFNVNDLSRLNYLGNLAKLYVRINNYERAFEIYGRITFEIRFQVERNLFYLNEQEKIEFWKVVDEYFNYYFSFAIKTQKEDPAAIRSLLEAHLYSKSIIFDEIAKIRKLSYQSGGSTLINKKIELLKVERDSLANEYLLQCAYPLTNHQKLKNLLNNIGELQKQIAESVRKNSKPASSDQKLFDLSIVNSKILPGEAVVEIKRLLYNNSEDNIYYLFFIIDGDDVENPELVVLENGNDLENRFINFYSKSVNAKIADTVSYNAYWGKIDKFISHCKKIYLSGDGVYNQINIESLKNPNEGYLFEKYEITNINSVYDSFNETVNLEAGTDKKIVLIGAPKFSLNQNQKMKNTQELRPTAFNYKIKNIGSLPSAKKEIDSVASLASSIGYTVEEYYEEKANEGIFKNFNNPYILHIATHAIYLNDLGGNSSELNRIDKNMFCSGLFLAGIKNCMWGNFNSECNVYDDGYLSAYELMNMDFRDTKLVVLSACETGLGQFESGGGIYGLRRSFLIGGSKSIILSLWEVDDKVSQELMIEFYKNLFINNDIEKSFFSAKQAIKNKYNSPYFWAAFILVKK